MKYETVKTVLFGCGYTLKRLAKKFPTNTIVLVARSAERVAELQQQFPFVEQVDIADKAQVESFWERYASIESFVDSVPPLVGLHEAATGAANILAAMPSSVKRAIYLSTTGVFGVTSGAVADEETPANPFHERGKRRWEVEQVYGAHQVASTVFRLPAIYGPGRGIGMALRAGRYPFVDNGERWSNRIHVDDIVLALQAALESESELPPLLCVTDDAPTLTKEVVQYYCEKFSFDFPQSISYEDAAARGMQSLLSNVRVSNKRMKEVLGIELRYPSYKEGAGTEFSS